MGQSEGIMRTLMLALGATPLVGVVESRKVGSSSTSGRKESWVRELARHLGPGPVVGAEDPGEYMPPKGGRLFFVSAMLSVKRHV